MKEAPINTKNVVQRLEAMLKREGYDQQTTVAQVNQIRNVIRDLKKLGKQTDVMSEEELAQMRPHGKKRKHKN